MRRNLAAVGRHDGVDVVRKMGSHDHQIGVQLAHRAHQNVIQINRRIMADVNSRAGRLAVVRSVLTGKLFEFAAISAATSSAFCSSDRCAKSTGTMILLNMFLSLLNGVRLDLISDCQIDLSVEPVVTQIKWGN